MVNRPKNIGTAAESAVVKALRRLGFPHAERRSLRGGDDWGDITGTPGIVWEVKGGDAARKASDGLIAEWLFETEIERHNAGADVGVLVVARKGIGTASAERWWAIVPYIAAYDLRSGNDTLVQPDTWGPVERMPVRFYLGSLCHLLRAAGYGQTPAAAPHGHVAGDRVRTADGWQPVQTLGVGEEL